MRGKFQLRQSFAGKVKSSHTEHALLQQAVKKVKEAACKAMAHESRVAHARRLFVMSQFLGPTTAAIRKVE